MSIEKDLPLNNVRVLDLTAYAAGPLATMLLGDMGADVVKVEQPQTGDTARLSLNHFLKGSDSAPFLAVNRNKRSITLNLKNPDAKDLFFRLASEADMIFESYRPGVAKRLGVDYEAISVINPKIIYASVSGFGQTGPYSSRAGFDLIAQGMSGWMSVTGHSGAPPAKSSIPVADFSAGMLLHTPSLVPIFHVYARV